MNTPYTPSDNPIRTWPSRALIGVVLFLNLQCAVSFLVWPAAYAPSFELHGEIGEALIRSIGLLFVMWNVPYVFAFLDPRKNALSLLEAILMQAIGVAGETALLLTLPGVHPVLSQSLVRFIIFDGAGLCLLTLARVLLDRRRG